MSNNNALLEQVRTAHRLLAAFYQRLHGNIRDLGAALDLNFYVWEPVYTARPTNLSTNPLERWQWDMLPAMASYFIFKTDCKPDQVEVGHYMVEIKVDSDTGFDGKVQRGQQPDALNLATSVEQAESKLSVRVYAPTQELDLYWYHDIWRKCVGESVNQEPMLSDKYPMVSAQFEMNISELMEEGALEQLIERTNALITRVQEKVEATVV